jgi:hypothetical protein
VQQADDLLDHLGQIDRLRSPCSFLNSTRKTPDHLRGALRVGRDVAQAAGTSGSTRVESDWSRRRATWAFGGDGRERLVDLVRERGGELAQRGHPERVRELFALALGLLLGLPRRVTSMWLITTPPSGA